MLFTTFTFVLAFLPIVLAVYLLLLRFELTRAVLPWLSLTSLVFYGWTDVRLLGVIALSLAVNYSAGALIARSGSRFAVAAGVSFNVALLCWIKYAGLLGDTLGLDDFGPNLPLVGISFYTFQQIAWLADMRTRPTLPGPWNFVVFVTFFPQLIAGPIVHHAEMMPQFSRQTGDGRQTYLSQLPDHLAVGLTIFIIGLFKKVVIADNCALLVGPVFTAASGNHEISTVAAWGGVMAYTMQIYFDFSGYSDMAVGIARLFGIRLPQNFHSPYKAASIIEFWRRWHITLSRWLGDYVYIPLGGNRKGPLRRHINLMVTMLLGGLWHGASWSFLVWGGLHGVLLVVNHTWQRVVGVSLGITGWFLTFVAVMHAWVLFRAGNHENDFETAANVFAAMYRWTPEGDPADYRMVLFALLIAVVWPNTYEFMQRYRPSLDFRSFNLRSLRVAFGVPFFLVLSPWQPTRIWAMLTAALAAICLYVVSRSDAYVEFIYFQF